MAESRVKVAVRVRPLLPREALREPLVCVQTSPAHPGQVVVGNQRAFAFDFAFGPSARQEDVYAACVQPLVTSLLEGYNATVFAYGQTGSGKTYTISGGPVVSTSGGQSGIIPRAVEEIFRRLAQMPDTSYTVRASYVEVYREELRDLLELETSSKVMHIREDKHGNTVLIGAREQEVESGEEFLTLLEAGNAARRTGANQLNEHSSRSHALLTVAVTQRRSDPALSVASKFHLVDLAGSERLTSGPASPRHLQESVQINNGLLALGNVIRALSSPRRRSHVPYRDAKITRLLRDSLGGNARTLMVACVSPAAACLQESLSSLLFASRARDVHNRPTLNLAELGAELRAAREGPAGPRGQPARLQALQEQLAQESRRGLRYRALAQDAARLLLEGRGSAPGPAHDLRVQEWLEMQEELENDGPAHNGDGLGAEFQYSNVLQLRRELNRCQEALATDERLFSEREQQVKELQEQVSRLQEQCEALLAALQDERNRNRLQGEQLVEQQLVAERLRDLLSSSTSPSTRRPYSVPLIAPLSRESPNHGGARKVHTSPPAYSLERVMACFRTRSQLLKAQIQEEDEVLLQGYEEEEQQGAKEEDDQSRTFRRSLNLTWTRRSSLAPTHGGRDRRLRPSLQTRATSQSGEEAESGCGDSFRGGADSAEVCSPGPGPVNSLQLLSHARQSHARQSVSETGLKERLIEDLRKTDRNGLQEQDGRLQLEEQRRWLEQEEERVLQQRRGLEELREELQRREELLARREALSQERSQIHLKKLRSSQVLERDLLSVSTRLSLMDKELQQGGAAVERLREEREQLCRRRDVLDDRLKDGSVLSPQEEHTLFQVEEAIEVLDAVVEYKDLSIHSRQQASVPPPSDGDMMDRLSALPPPHIKVLLLNYFNKVVTLREEERMLRLQCEEQQLQLQEQVGVAGELEAALQRLTVATDRRLTQQQTEHQQSLQRLLQQLSEARGEVVEQNVRRSEGRVQELEKELFFYKSSSRQLRRKLREINPAFSIEAPPSRGSGHESAESSLCDTPAHSTQLEEAPPSSAQGRKRLAEESGRRRGGGRAEAEPMRLPHSPRLQVRHSTLLSFQEDSIEVSHHQGQ
ncbi:kinesin-like protein KIF27 [Conger conger]|uniref:kinesin-like protein KIF27 n=1 Tax=Conger conger TaxID=82655 RepID=UPI002A5AF58E|nr:kinesin-like protein KIF27 [Conger conger]